MTAVGVLSLLLGFLAIRVAVPQRSQSRALTFFAVAVVHLLSCLAYFWYVQTHPADTTLYYFDRFNFYRNGFGIGTQAVVFFVQFCKGVIGGTYLDYFLLFQAIGLWGLAILMRTIDETYNRLGAPQAPSSYLVLFLPGLQFWTSAIGKDAPLFLASSLAVWSAIDLRRRYFMFSIAVVVMLIFRAELAGVALLSVSLAMLFSRRLSPAAHVGMLIASLAIFAITTMTLRTWVGIDITSAGSVGTFLEAQSDIAQRSSGGTDVVGASYPVRLFSLLFRPFFFDADGPFALLASLENVFLVWIFYRVVHDFHIAGRLISNVFAPRFHLIFAMLTAILLALVYYNVGLGLRHRTMMLPALLAFFSATRAVSIKRLRASGVIAPIAHQLSRVTSELPPHMSERT